MVKNLTVINESAFDSLILSTTRFIVNQFKKKEDFSTYFYFERGNEYAEVNFSCNFVMDEDLEYPFSISGESDMDTLIITVQYDPEQFPEAMKDMVAELKETVAHELEHIGQQNFEDMHVMGDDDDSFYDDYLNYLTSKIEVPAYVKGLITRSRTKKMSLSRAMDEWFQENIKNFKNPEKDWEKVKKIWMDHAHEMLSKQKVKKFS